MKDWIIEKYQDDYNLIHTCEGGKRSICCKVRDSDMWVCKNCFTAAPEEMSFAADLGHCRKNRPNLTSTNDEDFTKALGEMIKNQSKQNTMMAKIKELEGTKEVDELTKALDDLIQGPK